MAKSKSIVFRRNPAGAFLSTIVNKAKRMKKRRKKNPGKQMVLRGIGTEHRKASKKAWHHKKGSFVYNKVRKLAAAKRRKKLAAAAAMPVPSTTTPMSKKRRKKRTRNPVRTSKRGRSSYRRRNRVKRRRGMFRRRNPSAFREVGSRENLIVAAGALTGIAGTKWFLNMLLKGDATGKRMFDLPGITYPQAGQTMTPAQFYQQNKLVLAAYEIALPSLAWYFLRGKAPVFARGLLIAAPVNAGIAALKQTQFGQQAGMGAFLRTYIPGVPPILSGQATAFINNGAPVRRPGMGAVVNRNWAMATLNGKASAMSAT